MAEEVLDDGVQRRTASGDATPFVHASRWRTIRAGLALEDTVRNTDMPRMDGSTTQLRGSWLNQRVALRAPEGVVASRRGWVVHVGTDRKLLVLWDDAETPSIVAPEDLVPHRVVS
jgi:hypothetical protein